MLSSNITVGANGHLWFGGQHYGDWLELTAPFGECKGQTLDDLIASAFYAHSTRLVCLTGQVLGLDVTEYQAQYELIRQAFAEEFAEDDENLPDLEVELILPQLGA